MLTKKLKNLRTLNNLTQEELAKQLTISRVRYTNYETGKRSPDLEMLHQIADFYGVTTDYLLGHKVQPYNNTLFTAAVIESKNIDQELEEILQKIQFICSDLVMKSEVLDEITKIALFNALKNVMEMVTRMCELKNQDSSSDR